VLADLSDGGSSSNGTPAERAAEAKAAAKILGVEDRINLGLPDTSIRSEDAEQLRRVVACIRESRPELALIPSGDDPHPDHASGAVLVQRGLFLAGVHGYEAGKAAWKVPHVVVYPGRNEIEPHYIADISSTWVTKIDAIRAHESQFIAGDNRMPTTLNAPEFIPMIEARSRLYGHRIGVAHGEPLRSLRPLALTARTLDIFGA
jgi:bacillithiol biosynthesis deacetylase BshB1